MKKLFIITILLSGYFTSLAQSPNGNEWFRQKKTQLKYLLQQIAALKVYLGYLKDGYDITKKGLNIIGDIKDGNFNSHSEYFGSLKLVNNSIKNSSKVASIIAYQNLIIRDFQKLLQDTKHSGFITGEEKKYINEVYDNLLIKCEEALGDLETVITAKQLEMKDDERLMKIALIYEDMKDKYAFTRSFSNSTSMLIMQRSHESTEIENSGKIISNEQL
jgi:hypothetical protein